MIRPTYGILTNIGDAHGENFESKQQKLNEKSILFSDCEFVIGEKSLLTKDINLKNKYNIKTFLWGTDEKVAVKIVESKIVDKKRKVILQYKNSTIRLSLPYLDNASFENIMNVVSMLLAMGKNLNDIKSKLELVHPVAMRMDIREGINNSLLIVDYYNLDIESLNHALMILNQQGVGRNKVAVLSDFSNSGMDEDLLYCKVSDLLKRAHIDKFIGIGETLSNYKDKFDFCDSSFYNSTDLLLKSLNRNDFKEEVILLKGARNYRFEYISSYLQKKSHRTELLVDVAALERNFNYFKSLVPANTRFAAMVKAFSYGSGMTEVARFLQAKGIDYLMVAFADEGVELRAKGISVPIAVMNPDSSTFDIIIEFNLEPEIYSLSLLSIS